MRSLLFVFVLFAIGAALVVRLAPWYVSVGLAVLLVLSSRLLARLLIYRLFTMPFKAKGRVLENAVAEVHGIQPAATPDAPKNEYDGGEDLDEEQKAELEHERREACEELKKRNWFTVDVEIKPQPNDGAFTHWEPSELSLVHFTEDTAETDCESVECLIHDLKIHSDGKIVDYEGDKYTGPQRLQLLIGVKADVERLKFQYYYEGFGEVVLPGK